MKSAPVSRRESWRRALGLALLGSGGIAPLGSSAQPPSGKGSVLVTYMSRSGNTRVIAGQIRRAREADLFEIEPAQPYPEDYRQTVDQAKRETDAGYEPRLRHTVPNIAMYKLVFLGFPIWGMTMPPVVRSFLSQHDLSGKVLVPFITHGGYGTGQSLAVLARHATKARIMDAFVMQADQERDTLERVTRWLNRSTSGR